MIDNGISRTDEWDVNERQTSESDRRTVRKLARDDRKTSEKAELCSLTTSRAEETLEAKWKKAFLSGVKSVHQMPTNHSARLCPCVCPFVRLCIPHTLFVCRQSAMRPFKLYCWLDVSRSVEFATCAMLSRRTRQFWDLQSTPRNTSGWIITKFQIF